MTRDELQQKVIEAILDLNDIEYEELKKCVVCCDQLSNEQYQIYCSAECSNRNEPIPLEDLGFSADKDGPGILHYMLWGIPNDQVG